MAKALVIKGASFFTNRVTAISFSDSVPCTGISFSSDSISITDYTPVTVSYTVTPADTTDTINWASSDTDVVAVADGVLTAVGLGTATVTATCGEYSATATVTVNVACSPVWYAASVSNADDTAITGSNSQYRVCAFGTGAQATEYKYAQSDSSTPKSAIKLPKNTAAIRISITAEHASDFSNNTYTTVYFAKDEASGWASAPNAIKYVSNTTAYNITAVSNYVKTFEVPSGANAIFVQTRLSQDVTSGNEYTSTVEATGLMIEFLQSAS